MYCQKCGAEIPHGEFLCAVCGKPDAPEPERTTSLSKRLIKAIVVSATILFFILIIGTIALLPIFQAINRSTYMACFQDMQRISKGLQIYQSEKSDFNSLTQSGGNGDEICDHILIGYGYDKAADCVGKVSRSMARACNDYRIDVNKPAPFQYEITGHSHEITNCGICVTEKGFCPTKYSGKESENSPCKKSCKDAGLNSTAVCPH